VLCAIISFFLPSHLLLEKSINIANDKEVTAKQIEKYQLKNIINYQIDKESINWKYIENEQGVELLSTIDVNLGFNPITKFTALFDKNEINLALEKQLDSLKNYIESLPKIHTVKVEKKMLEKPIWYLSLRDTIKRFEMNNVQGKLYAQINQYMNEHDLQQSSTPIVVYHLWTEIVDIEVGIPISDSIMVNDNRIKMKKIKPQNVVTAIHYGPYNRMPETYFGINEWMRKNKVVVTGVPWESYITNPTEENNPEKWQTSIFFPVE